MGTLGVTASWNVLRMSSLYKGKGDVSDPNKYRGLSVMTTLPKVYSVILNAKVCEQARERGLRTPVQGGFRAGYCTEDNCVVLKTVLERAKLLKYNIWCLFINLEKAYDRVDRN